MSQEIISDRAQLLLHALVQRYIREGQPVGSKTLLEETGLSVSSATARNVLADLEDRGFLESPHTSAGRVPTQQAYRYFVDSIVTVNGVDEEQIQVLQAELNPNKTSKELAEAASRVLSSISAQAGLVTVPRQQLTSLRQIEFLPLSGARILVVLIVNEKEVHNRVLQANRDFSELELRRASNWINQHFAGSSLMDIRDGLFRQMHADKQHLDASMQSVLDFAGDAFVEPEGQSTDYVVAGERQLVNAAQPEDIDKLRDLFAAFEYKREMLDLVDRCIGADGVQIFIGEESGYDAFDQVSVITSPYGQQGQRLGVLGVIGPTRMAYDKLIPIVDITAKMLSIALEGG